MYKRVYNDTDYCKCIPVHPTIRSSINQSISLTEFRDKRLAQVSFLYALPLPFNEFEKKYYFQSTKAYNVSIFHQGYLTLTLFATLMDGLKAKLFCSFRPIQFRNFGKNVQN